MDTALRENLAVRAGLQNVLQIFITNAANVFLLEVSPEYPILLDEQVRGVTCLKINEMVPTHRVLLNELKLCNAPISFTPGSFVSDCPYQSIGKSVIL